MTTCEELAKTIARMQSLPGAIDEARRWYRELVADPSGQRKGLPEAVKTELGKLKNEIAGRNQG